MNVNPRPNEIRYHNNNNIYSDFRRADEREPLSRVYKMCAHGSSKLGTRFNNNS